MLLPFHVPSLHPPSHFPPRRTQRAISKRAGSSYLGRQLSEPSTAFLHAAPLAVEPQPPSLHHSTNKRTTTSKNTHPGAEWDTDLAAFSKLLAAGILTTAPGSAGMAAADSSPMWLSNEVCAAPSSAWVCFGAGVDGPCCPILTCSLTTPITCCFPCYCRADRRAG